MTFTEKSRKNNVLFGGVVALTITTFKLEKDITINSRTLVHEFINSPQDFDIATKFVDGFSWDHTDEHGVQKIFMVHNFGPYIRKELSIDDYEIINYDTLLNKTYELVSEVGEINKLKKEYINFVRKIPKLYDKFSKKGVEILSLNPTKNKLAEFSAFQEDCYFCAFCIDKKNNMLNVIQIDDN